MTSTTRHGVTNFVKTRQDVKKIRHDVNKIHHSIKKFVKTSKYPKVRREVRNTS